MRIPCLAIFICALWSGPVLAGDHYFDCAAPNSSYTLKEGGKQLELFEGKKKRDYQLVRKLTIQQQTGFCTTKNGQRFAWNSHQYLMEIKTNINGSPIELMFLCEQGSSGVPANVSNCTMSTTSNKRIKPTHTLQRSPEARHSNKNATSSKLRSYESWSSLIDGNTASAIYAWSSGCKKDCNDEVDYIPILSIDCSKKSKTAEVVFWELGREKEFDRQVGVWVSIDDHTTRLKARGASKLTGVSLDAKLPIHHPFFEELAAGATITYGSTSGSKGKQIKLTGSGKAVRRMLSACR